MNSFLIETRMHPDGRAVPVMVLRTLTPFRSGGWRQSYSFFVDGYCAGERVCREAAAREAAFLVETGAMDLLGLSP